MDAVVQVNKAPCALRPKIEVNDALPGQPGACRGSKRSRDDLDVCCKRWRACDGTVGDAACSNLKRAAAADPWQPEETQSDSQCTDASHHRLADDSEHAHPQQQQAAVPAEGSQEPPCPSPVSVNPKAAARQPASCLPGAAAVSAASPACGSGGSSGCRSQQMLTASAALDPVTSATRSVVEASQAICAASAASIAAALAKLQSASRPPFASASPVAHTSAGAYYAAGIPAGSHGRVCNPLSIAIGSPAGRAAAGEGTLFGYHQQQVLSPQPSASSCFASPPISPSLRHFPMSPTAAAAAAAAGTAACASVAAHLASPPPVVTVVTGPSAAAGYRTLTLRSLPLAAALAQSHSLHVPTVPALDGRYQAAAGAGSCAMGAAGGWLSGMGGPPAVWGVPVTDSIMQVGNPGSAAAALLRCHGLGVPNAAAGAMPAPLPRPAAAGPRPIVVPQPCMEQQQVDEPCSPGSACSDSVSPAAPAAARRNATSKLAAGAAATAQAEGTAEAAAASASGSEGRSAGSAAAAMQQFQQQLLQELRALQAAQRARLAAAAGSVSPSRGSSPAPAAAAAVDVSRSGGESPNPEQVAGLQQGMDQDVAALQQRLLQQLEALQQQLA